MTNSSGASGSANGAVQITVESNLMEPSRTGSVVIAGQTVLVTQAALGDFNGDGHPDLIWLNNGTHQAAVWYLGGTEGNTYQSWAWLNAANMPGWTLRGAADFNGDGHPDLIWQKDSTRQVAVWYMGGAQGNTYQSWAWLSGGGLPGWTLVSAADLNGDGHPDLIWQNDTTRQVAIW